MMNVQKPIWVMTLADSSDIALFWSSVGENNNSDEKKQQKLCRALRKHATPEWSSTKVAIVAASQTQNIEASKSLCDVL